MARPSSSNNFCCICKIAFGDYLSHLLNPYHQDLMKNSDFNKDILQLARLFSNNQEEEVQVKTKGRGRGKGESKAKAIKKEHKT